jgi:hypothetical protein
MKQTHFITRRQFLSGAAATLLGAALSTLRAPRAAAAGPIIADHTVVDKYVDIPQFYINQVKKMWVTVPGESHSAAYRRGCEYLEAQDSRFQANVTESGTPEAYTDQYLRLSAATWGDVGSATGWRYSYGEEDWYTSSLAIQRTKDHLTYCKTQGPALAAMGFGWCWDMTWQNSPGGGLDAVHQVHWAGSSVGTPDSDPDVEPYGKRWGLDADDFTLTGNHVCMDTYLDGTQQYISHCQVNNCPTQVFFTTGPVDGGGNTGENGYQRHLKHEHIRNYVNADSSRILFDYADILCWSDAGIQNTTTWTDYGSTLRTFQYIHNDNLKDLSGNPDTSVGHIGARGALRLAKALWWMLARIAGWDGARYHVYLPLAMR